jgi:hypothetical protein
VRVLSDSFYEAAPGFDPAFCCLGKTIGWRTITVSAQPSVLGFQPNNQEAVDFRLKRIAYSLWSAASPCRKLTAHYSLLNNAKEAS